MKLDVKINISVALISCYLLLFWTPQLAHAQQDTSLPKKGWRSKFHTYVDSIKSRRYRDSILFKISRHNDPPPSVDDSSMIRSEQGFLPHTGKVIRHVYFRKVKVFGPQNINDTTFTTSMRLIHLANRLHFDSEEWAIRQMLFFRAMDTVNAYELADNERYLRSRPFIQDARILVLEPRDDADSVDIQVVTKDIFEYSADLQEITPKSAALRISNNNLFGAAQGLSAGFRWNSNWARALGTEARYTKYNVFGTFMDVSVGYTTLSNNFPLDTGVYEGSYFVSISRPLYRNSARFAGGVMVARNNSINIHGPQDSLYRDYVYKVYDIWGGYTFLNRYSQDGHFKKRPSLAALFRHYNMRFDQRPKQAIYEKDPIYNNRHYYLAQLLLFKQDFFKTHHFYGFGRTEDIPYGYNARLSAGWENWIGRKRFYTGFEAQKFWHTRLNGLLSADIGVGSFWQGKISEDAVIHANLSYYSKLMEIGKWNWRLFTYADYLGTPNNYFYKPLNVNYENGIWGFRETRINGYHRLNLRGESVFYTNWKVYGFKFNWFASVQASQLSYQNSYLVKNPIHSGYGVGLRVRNENLSLNTLKIAAYHYPNPPLHMRKFYFELTTQVDFRFDIFAMRPPSFLPFF